MYLSIHGISAVSQSLIGSISRNRFAVVHNIMLHLITEGILDVISQVLAHLTDETIEAQRG